MNIQRIEENEIPYEELGKFGLTQEMIDDLPEPIMNKLLGGMRTPLLPIEQVDGDGVIHKDFARIRLIKEGEQVHPMFLPVKNQCNLEYFTGEEKEALERGKVLKVILPSNNSWNYVQLDSATNSIISVKSNLVDNNLSLLANNMGMDEDHILKLENGEVVTLENDDQKLSIGLTLMRRQVFSVSMGMLRLGRKSVMVFWRLTNTTLVYMAAGREMTRACFPMFQKMNIPRKCV